MEPEMEWALARLEWRYEKEITEVYRQAADEVTKKWEQYTKDFARKDAIKRKLVETGELSKEDYAKWRKGQILIGKRWKEQADVLAKDLTNADKIAVSLTKGYMEEAYALGHNYGTFLVEKGSLVNTSYTLYSRETVERLIRDEPRLLNVTQWELNHPKDLHWNQKHITHQITQGILQGEDIRQVSKRLQNVTSMDKGAAMRNARTAMTGAQNGGRIDAYKRAESLGIELEKEWLATVDGKTRESHIELDGEHVPMDEKFSNGCMYPGDPKGKPEEVYNCRCTLIPRRLRANYKNERRFMREEDLNGMSYDEWKESRGGRYEVEKEDVKTRISGPDYSIRELEEPIRPRKSDFVGGLDYGDEYDAAEQRYLEARDEYRKQRDEYDKALDNAVEKSFSFNQFESWESVDKWATEKGISISDEFKEKIDIRIMGETSHALDKLYKDYPDVFGYSRQMYDGSVWNVPFELGVTYQDDALAVADNGISFATAFMPQYSETTVKSFYDQMIGGVNVMGNGTFETLVTHEFGHNVQSYIEAKMGDKYHYWEDDWRKNFSSFNEFKTAKESFLADRDRYNKELLSLAGLKGSSEYSNTNTAELFAEGFAEFATGGKSEFGIKFGEFLKRWYP